MWWSLGLRRRLRLRLSILRRVHLSIDLRSVHLLPILRRVGGHIAVPHGVHTAVLLLHLELLLELKLLELLELNALELIRVQGLLGVDLNVRRLELGAVVEGGHHGVHPVHLLELLLLEELLLLLVLEELLLLSRRQIEGGHVGALGLALLLPVGAHVHREVAARKRVLLRQTGLRTIGLGIAPVHCRRNGEGKPC